MSVSDNLKSVLATIPSGVTLTAVSKFHPSSAIREAYSAGQRVFAESRPQEFEAKYRELSDLSDIEWHFIGHLQTNKLKMVLPYVAMVESVDSLHLLKAIDKWSTDNGRITDVLLELHIASEQTKQGFTEEEILEILFNADSYKGIRLRGLMGMATNTDDEGVVEADFTRIDSFMAYLKGLFAQMEDFDQLSIGMSSDYLVALRHGTTSVRIGTAIFGQRQYQV